MRRCIQCFIVLLVMPSASSLRAEPIHEAARKGDVAEVKRLLKQDPKLVNLVETGITSGVMPLHYAAEKGHKAIVELLLASGARIYARGSRGTALELAIYFGHDDLAELLLRNGARLDIFSAAGLGKTDQIEHFLQADETLIDATDFDGQTALHWAAFTGQKTAVELLLAKGAKINQQKSTVGAWCWSGTPLHFAAWRGRNQIVELLVANGAEVNARDECGQTPLLVAVYNEQVAVAEILIAHKADVNACEDRVCPSLINILENCHVRKPPMITPLHRAASLELIGLVNLLIAKGADVNAKDSHGLTPLNWSRGGAVADLLRAAGAKE